MKENRFKIFFGNEAKIGNSTSIMEEPKILLLDEPINALDKDL